MGSVLGQGFGIIEQEEVQLSKIGPVQDCIYLSDFTWALTTTEQYGSNG